MARHVSVARRELILGGQKSGKSRRAESLAGEWLAASPAHRAVLVATAQAWDDEMRQRIARHQRDRTARVPAMTTVEEPLQLAAAIRQHSRADTLLVIDCLTLWLTNLLMPAHGDPSASSLPGESEPLDPRKDTSLLLAALSQAPGPLVLVGNEIGMGVIPLGREVRHFVDALGGLNQQVARACERVTLMVAGLPLAVKEPPCVP